MERKRGRPRTPLREEQLLLHGPIARRLGLDLSDPRLLAKMAEPPSRAEIRRLRAARTHWWPRIAYRAYLALLREESAGAARSGDNKGERTTANPLPAELEAFGRSRRRLISPDLLANVAYLHRRGGMGYSEIMDEFASAADSAADSANTHVRAERLARAVSSGLEGEAAYQQAMIRLFLPPPDYEPKSPDAWRRAVTRHSRIWELAEEAYRL